MRIEMLPAEASLEARLHYMRRRRRDAVPRRALTAVGVIVAIAWAVMIGLGLFLR
jgi:hypothetical protein